MYFRNSSGSRAIAITRKPNHKSTSRLLACLHTTTLRGVWEKRMCKLCDLDISSWKLIIPLIPFLNKGLLNFSTTPRVRHHPCKSRVQPAPPPSCHSYRPAEDDAQLLHQMDYISIKLQYIGLFFPPDPCIFQIKSIYICQSKCTYIKDN